MAKHVGNENTDPTKGWVRSQEPVDLTINESQTIKMRTVKFIGGKEVYSEVKEFKYIIDTPSVTHTITVDVTQPERGTVTPSDSQIIVEDNASLSIIVAPTMGNQINKIEVIPDDNEYDNYTIEWIDGTASKEIKLMNIPCNISVDIGFSTGK